VLWMRRSCEMEFSSLFFLSFVLWRILSSIHTPNGQFRALEHKLYYYSYYYCLWVGMEGNMIFQFMISMHLHRKSQSFWNSKGKKEKGSNIFMGACLIYSSLLYSIIVSLQFTWVHPLDVKCEPYVACLLLDLVPSIFPILPKISCWYRRKVQWSDGLSHDLNSVSGVEIVIGNGQCEPAPTSAPWRMNDKWSGNNFLLGSSSLANHGG
jgi:hypothetical protein